ncbi:acetyl-CoA C-acetyltransferase [Burkholderiales bacterium]|nr:acetyl-CoA C-acetyltransferase [Burkholderiales bacterium]
MKREVVVVAGCRTAQGTFGGTLRDVPAHELVRTPLQQVVARAGVSAEAIETVIVGQVYQTSQALNIGRFCALEAGFPFSVSGTAVNAACGSSLEAFNCAVREIAQGDSDVVIAAGTESMSGIPFLLHGHRWGTRRGNSEVVDQFEESTWSASTYRYGRFNMGMAADHVAKVYSISRREQDEYAQRSHALAVKAIDGGLFRDEIVPLTVKRRQGEIEFLVDEHPRRDCNLEALSKLAPTFGEDGTVTAGSASGVSDGAAAAMLMSREKADALGVKPLARVLSTARVGVDPRLICMSPAPAASLVLKRAGLRPSDIGWWEINEAFSSVVLSSCRELGIGLDRVNPLGGGIALGHPVGCSGVRTVVTMIHAMRRTGARYGVATIGAGGGMGVAALVELCE